VEECGKLRPSWGLQHLRSLTASSRQWLESHMRADGGGFQCLTAGLLVLLLALSQPVMWSHGGGQLWDGCSCQMQ